jgi:hypothetical protein
MEHAIDGGHTELLTLDLDARLHELRRVLQIATEGYSASLEIVTRYASNASLLVGEEVMRVESERQARCAPYEDEVTEVERPARRSSSHSGLDRQPSDEPYTSNFPRGRSRLGTGSEQYRQRVDTPDQSPLFARPTAAASRAAAGCSMPQYVPMHGRGHFLEDVTTGDIIPTIERTRREVQAVMTNLTMMDGRPPATQDIGSHKLVMLQQGKLRLNPPFFLPLTNTVWFMEATHVPPLLRSKSSGTPMVTPGPHVIARWQLLREIWIYNIIMNMAYAFVLGSPGFEHYIATEYDASPCTDAAGQRIYIGGSLIQANEVGPLTLPLHHPLLTLDLTILFCSLPRGRPAFAWTATLRQ